MKTIRADNEKRRFRFRLAALGGLVAVGVGLWFLLRGCGPERQVNSVGMALVRIPAGTFTRGSSAEEKAWARDHGGRPEWIGREPEPARVRIARAFWIGETEVTIAQFRRFVKASGYRTVAEREEGPLAWSMAERGWLPQPDRSWANPGFPHDDSHPAVCLNWKDAQAFCRWLTERERAENRIGTNDVYRMPFESEWEYACRERRAGRFAWGDEPEGAARHANVLDETPLPDGSRWNAPHMPWTDGWAFTAPVGSFAPAAYGLRDQHGNAWEWCRPDEASADEAADATNNGMPHWLRGGSWDNAPGNVRCASRRPAPKDFASDTTGFRVVRAAEGP